MFLSTQSTKLAKQIDLTACDKEPIHIPGCIQPHGFLLAVQEPDLTIAQLSDNVQYFLNRPPASLLGLNLHEIVGNDYYDYLKEQLRISGSLKELNPLNIVFTTLSHSHSFDVSLHRSGGLLILEFEPTIPRSENHAQQFYKQSQSAIRRLQLVTSLNELFNRIVQEVKLLSGYDRVMLYQFFEEHGQVVGEACEPELESYLGLHYPASDIPVQARAMYLKNSLRIITDVNYSPSALTPTDNPITDLPLDLSLAVLRSVSPIHLQYLKNMGVKASLTISIIIDNKLWGLITCHHQQPKFAAYEIRVACELLGQVVAWQIATLQAKMFSEQLTNQQQLLNTIYDNFKEHVPWHTSIIAQADALMELVKADGITICYEGNYHLQGKVPAKKEIIKLASQATALTTERVYDNACIATIFKSAASYSDIAAGIMVSLLSPGDGDFIIWFRPEIIQTIKWGGDPNKPVTVESGNARLMPRQSFAAWQEQVKNHALPWKPAEIEAVKQLTRFLIEMKLKHYYQAAKDRQTKKAMFAEEMRKKQQNFIDRICHEIRNPINGILGSLELVRNQLEMMQTMVNQVSPEETFKTMLISQLDELRSHLDNIDECAKHQTVITNDVLSLAKLRQHKVIPDNQPYELVQTIQTVINMFSVLIDKKGLQFKVSLPETAIWIKSDVKILKQILINLLTNAVKFTQQGGISLTLTEHAKTANQAEYHITLEDSGIGITAEQKTRLFQSFEQANANIASIYGGSGLGLSISLELVKLLGGNIKVESQFGQGSTFTIIMQVETLSPQEQEAVTLNQNRTLELTQSLPVHQPVNQRVLIVEDNLINQKILMSILTQAGYACDIAENGQIAVEKYRTFSYQFIFMDIQMPIMNGYEAAKRIRQIEQSSNRPPAYIICLSANISEEYKIQAQEAGMDNYLTKPFKKQEILDRLAQCVSHSTSSSLSERALSANSLKQYLLSQDESLAIPTGTIASIQGEFITPSTNVIIDDSTYPHKKRKNPFNFFEAKNDNPLTLEAASQEKITKKS